MGFGDLGFRVGARMAGSTRIVSTPQLRLTGQRLRSPKKRPSPSAAFAAWFRRPTRGHTCDDVIATIRARTRMTET